MYLVTIKNDGVETVINEVSVSTENRIKGTIKQGINTINTFTFSILPNNVGYDLIKTFKTLITVLNTKTNKYEFIGRVLTSSNAMDSNGLISKTFVCESELAYLLDTYQSYKELHDISVRGYLESLIQAHNTNTDTSKRFVVGEVNVTDSNNSLYRYIANESTKKNIDDDLIGKLGGEIQVRYENNTRYLDYLTEIGKTCDTQIRLAKNLKDITQDIDLNGYCNRLVVLGAKLEDKKNQNKEKETDTDYRVTIESVNNGLKYIDDPESIAKYGIIQGQVIFDDVKEAKNLLAKGQKHLLSQRLMVSNKVNALDLSLIGIDIDSFEVGNYYPLIHEFLGIDEVVRVVEKSISIENPNVTTITLGDLEKDIKKYNINAKGINLQAKSIAESVSSKVRTLKQYTEEEIGKANERINTIVNDSASSSEIKTILNEIKIKVDKIDLLEEKINTVLEILQTPAH